MHTTHPDGTVATSLCDFCARAWDPNGQEIMIEGHQGSLICLKCLTTAYADVVVYGGGHQHHGAMCSMCLEERSQPQWESPVDIDGVHARVCLRCMRQSATALEKDPESGWKRPGKPPAPGEIDDDE